MAARQTYLLRDGEFFLVAAGAADHVAAPGFVPTCWGAVTAAARCGAAVVAVGARNYSSRPCPLCLERSRALLRRVEGT